MENGMPEEFQQQKDCTECGCTLYYGWYDFLLHRHIRDDGVSQEPLRFPKSLDPSMQMSFSS